MLITNGINEKKVTKGAYEQFYKPLGYTPIVVIPYEPLEDVAEIMVEDEIITEPIEIEKKEKIVSQKRTPKKNKKK